MSARVALHACTEFCFRLFNRTEDLERLMNDEVTDINEILTVINTIQVSSLVCSV